MLISAGDDVLANPKPLAAADPAIEAASTADGRDMVCLLPWCCERVIKGDYNCN